MADDPPPLAGEGPVADLAGCRLTVDLGALAANYRMLADLGAPAETAAVVKADAYGTGIVPAVRALAAAGCRRFFVALPDEGIAARQAAPEAQVFVLDGLFNTEAAEACREAGLAPVLNTQSDIAQWEAHGRDGETPLPCALNVDTGMNRLGLTPERARVFAEENALTQAVSPVLVMSHLACADDPDHVLNRQQRESFQRLRELFPGIESSLANSAGIFLGADYHCDLTRPGIALYGGAAVNGAPNPTRPVVTAEARVLQVRRAHAGETVSYGASQTLARNSLIAVAAAGYADGYHRSASGGGVPLRGAVAEGASGFVQGRRVPVVGRVTMDLTMFDVTDLGPGGVHAGDFIELFGPNMPIDEVATAAGTIAYELLTSLGRRYRRSYVGDGS